MASPIPRRESSEVYQRLLRGEATSKEYVEAVRREVRKGHRRSPSQKFPWWRRWFCG